MMLIPLITTAVEAFAAGAAAGKTVCSALDD